MTKTLTLISTIVTTSFVLVSPPTTRGADTTLDPQVTPMGEQLLLGKSESTSLEAKLIGDEFAEGVAIYRETLRDGTLSQEFSVQVRGFIAKSKLLVTVDGFEVGVIVTDVNGDGGLAVKSTASMEKTAEGETTGLDLPRLRVGAIVKAGPMYGALR